jgi:1-phosphatidylinositol phosphodiesterase
MLGSNACVAASSVCQTAAIVAINSSDQNLYRWTRPTPLTGRFSDAAEVGTNWSEIRLIASDSASGDLFAVHKDGNLYRYSFGGSAYGRGDSIGRGWSEITQLIPAGNGVLYAVNSNGSLYWYRWLGSTWAKGSGTKIGHGWGQFSKVFNGGNGVLYAIDKDTGELKWYRHTTPTSAKARFLGPRNIGQGWGGFRSVIGLGDGVIYAIDSVGQLLSYQHTDPWTGDAVWANSGNGVQIGQGWDGYDRMTASPNSCPTGSPLVEWMSRVPDGFSLSRLSIPGTHDSGALYEFKNVPDTARAQSLTIAEQLNIGVRFLDIRLKRINNSDLKITHGRDLFETDQRIVFGKDVVEPIRNFLRAHPTESIMMSIKEESDPKNDPKNPITKTFEEILRQNMEDYPADDRGGKFKGWHTDSAIPNLGSVRGQIVLLRRFEHTSKICELEYPENSFTPYCTWVDKTTEAKLQISGIDATVGWPDNDAKYFGELWVEDHYDCPGVDQKWKYIVDSFDQATAWTRGNKPLSITFTSATDLGCWVLKGPYYYAYWLHPDLSDYLSLRKGSGLGLGIVVMDYVDENLSDEIIKTMTKDVLR